MIASIGSLLKGMLYGAGMMYFLDPDRGRRRRAGLVDRAVRLVHETEELWEKGCRDLANRSYGLAAEAKRAVAPGHPDDHVLVARVRSVLGHHVCDAKAVEADALNGIVTLRGTVRPGEPERLIPAVERIAGVRGVESALTTSGEPVETCPAPSLLTTPAARLLLTAGGGLLLLNGLMRRGVGPSLLGAAGAGMLVRGLTDHPGRLIGVGRDRGLEIHKSIRIAAPVEKVFEFFSDPVQMGGLLPYINRAEPLGDGRVRWHLEGPAGVGHVAFDERIVESVENERMVWESGPDAPVRYTGETRFQPDGDGTRVDLRFVYSPPGGMVADAAASVFGLDPKTLFDRSLNRIKHHLEEGTIPQGASDDAVREHRG